MISHDIIEEEEKIGEQYKLRVEQGVILEVEKLVSIYASNSKGISESCLDAQHSILFRLENKRFINLFSLHQSIWNYWWAKTDIHISLNNGDMSTVGDLRLTLEQRLKLILRLHAFHLQQVGNPNILGVDTSIPARGLSGESYRGHIFWDEIFIIPFFNIRMPEVTRSLLLYRAFRLDAARDRAKQLGYCGACYPWQSGSNGREETQMIHYNPLNNTWNPDNSQLQYHINIAIMYNIWNYYDITGDSFFLASYGAEMMLEMAKFWSSITSFNDSTKRYEIKGVMGPDEFHERYPDANTGGLNNNAYTNVMVCWCLEKTLFMVNYVLKAQRRRELFGTLHISNLELQRWRDITRKMTVPMSEDGIIYQFEGYQNLKEFEWEAYRKKYGADHIRRLDRILNAENDSANNYKVSKQADVCMIFYLLSPTQVVETITKLGYTFNELLIHKNIKYYMERTSHGSTLSEVVFSAITHQFDHDLSWNLYCKFVDSDIEDVQHGTTPEGLHMAAMAASISALIVQYGGVDTTGREICFKPKLPSAIKELQFPVQYQGKWLQVYVNQEVIRVTVDKEDTSSVQARFDNQYALTLAPGSTTEFKL